MLCLITNAYIVVEMPLKVKLMKSTTKNNFVKIFYITTLAHGRLYLSDLCTQRYVTTCMLDVMSHTTTGPHWSWTWQYM